MHSGCRKRLPLPTNESLNTFQYFGRTFTISLDGGRSVLGCHRKLQTLEENWAKDGIDGTGRKTVVGTFFRNYARTSGRLLENLRRRVSTQVNRNRFVRTNRSWSRHGLRFSNDRIPFTLHCRPLRVSDLLWVNYQSIDVPRKENCIDFQLISVFLKMRNSMKFYALYYLSFWNTILPSSG